MSEDDHISYLPTDGLCYDPAEQMYWDKDALDGEVTRAFEICHGCRMCFKYCDSFPKLFKFIDDAHDGDVRKLSATETRAVMDDCFQCKLCEVQCPYTPRDAHEFQLDFPKLVHRYQALAHRERGNTLTDSVLGNPDGTARLARASLGMANLMNRVGAHRWLLEKVLGIHRDKLLPDFAPATFERWARRQGLVRDPSSLPAKQVPAGEASVDESAPTSGASNNPPATRSDSAAIVPAPRRSRAITISSPTPEAVLFQTCYVQNNEPDIGKDTIFVLQRNGVDVACVRGLQCCGMPAWEHGDLQTLRGWARKNLDLLMPFVERGAKVLGINPTCTMMLRREWPELLEGEDRQRALELAEVAMDPSEFLWSIRKEARFNRDFRSTPGDRVAYHAPCHLRAQAKGFKGRDLLRVIPEVKPRLTMECCGHDGTYAMRVESFEASARIGTKAFEGMKEADSEVWATDCPLAAVQFQQHAGVKPMHPMSILARAYREDGFERRLPTQGDDREESKS